MLANERDKYYGDILSSCCGIIFMGTPHRGSGLATWAAIFQQIANTAMLSQSFRGELLKNLAYNSEILQTISRQFVQRSVKFPIRTFYEQEVTPPLTGLVRTYPPRMY